VHKSLFPPADPFSLIIAALHPSFLTRALNVAAVCCFCDAVFAMPAYPSVSAVWQLRVPSGRETLQP
jgi:hypothetical protein